MRKLRLRIRASQATSGVVRGLRPPRIRGSRAVWVLVVPSLKLLPPPKKPPQGRGLGIPGPGPIPILSPVPSESGFVRGSMGMGVSSPICRPGVQLVSSGVHPSPHPNLNPRFAEIRDATPYSSPLAWSHGRMDPRFAGDGDRPPSPIPIGILSESVRPGGPGHEPAANSLSTRPGLRLASPGRA